MTAVRRPRVTGSLRPDGTTVGVAEERVLIVGQKNGGTATSGALVTNILNDNSEDALYSPDSLIATAIRRYKRRNGITIIDAIGLDDNGAGTAAAGAIVFSGTATAAGTYTAYVGSKKFNKYTIAVAIGDTATVVGDALVAAITADTTALVTPVNTTGSVAVTAKNKGLSGNQIGIEISGSVAGLTTSVTGMTGGAVDPVLTGVFDVVGESRYQTIIWQFDDTTEVVDFLNSRFNVNNNILDGRAFYGKTDTLANHLTALSGLNSNSLCYNVDKLISRTNRVSANVFDHPFTKVAEFAAIRALRRTEGAVLGNNVISRTFGDSFGGIGLNSKPYFNTPHPDLIVPEIGDSWNETEYAQLESAGGFILGPNSAFNTVIAGDVVTTYKTDVAGNDDVTWKYLNYVDTATACREYIVNNTRAQYPQYRATGGQLIQNYDSSNEASVAAFVIEKIQELGDFALLSQGLGTINGEQVDYDKLHRENLFVTLNPATGRYSIASKLYIVTQFREALFDFAVAFEV